MQGYTQRVRESILPLSVAGSLPEAFEEWRFTGRTEDHEKSCETCQLCGQEGLRYHFEIANGYTQATLLVGSHCILQFNVAVYDGERKLRPAEAKKLLDKLTEKMRFESCLQALERLAEAEDNEILSNALAYYRENKKLTPKQAFVVFWRLRHHGIDHSPTFFSINLKRKRFKDDLCSMPKARVHYFWKALTPSQQQIAIECGHTPPLAS